MPAEYLGYSGFLLIEPPKCTHHTRDHPTATHITPCRYQMPSAHKHIYSHHTRCPHEAHNHSFPHHTGCPQHTTTLTPITPDALSTQPHLLPSHQMPCPHDSHEAHNHSFPHHTRHPPTTTHITPDQYSMHPQLPTSHQIHSAHNHSYLHRPKSLGLTHIPRWACLI